MLFNNSNNSYISKAKYVRREQMKETQESQMLAASNRQVQTAAYSNSRIIKPNMLRENTADYI